MCLVSSHSFQRADLFWCLHGYMDSLELVLIVVASLASIRSLVLFINGERWRSPQIPHHFVEHQVRIHVPYNSYKATLLQATRHYFKLLGVVDPCL